MPQRLNEALAAFQQGNLERAREIAASELELKRGSPQLQHLIGLIDCRSGRLESGVQWLREASEAQPGNVPFRVMLVRALVDSGRAEEALERAQPPSASGPAEMALWHARAEAADAAQRPDASAEAWQIVCAGRPGDWRAWGNLGNALAKLEKWPEAAQALHSAWELNPSEISVRRKYASALSNSGLQEEAARQFSDMLEIAPDDVQMRLTLSRLYADLGRHEDSMGELEKAAQAAVGESAAGAADSGLIRIALPDHGVRSPVNDDEVQSVRELALLLERTNRMQALRDLLADAGKIDIPLEQLGYPAAAIALRDGEAAEAKRLLQFESPDTDPVRWHRLMAKIRDSLGDHEGAFASAETMNRSVRDHENWVQRGSDYRTRLRRLEDCITAEWTSGIQPLSSDGRRTPAFLVGFPRSGTTLLDTFLMGHPDALVLEEFHMLGAAEAALGGVPDLPEKSAEQLDEARRAYFAELDRHADPSFEGLVLDKLPLNMLGLPMIYSIFPDARIIFAQRHPCDAVLSGFMQSFALNDAMACFLTIEGAADLYDVVMGVFSRARDLLPLEIHTLVYEQLVSDSETALRPLVDFLGLDWRDELLDHRATAARRGAIITPSYDQVVQPLSKAPSGRWRRYEKQLEPVLPILLPWAKRLGY